MSIPVKLQQLYEDLSTVLSLIKKKIKKMLDDPNETGTLQSQRQSEESALTTKSTQLIWKYKRVLLRQIQMIHLMDRFICRVKQIIKHLGSCIPKDKIQLLILSKKIQILLLKAPTFENATLTITSLLQMINNPNLGSGSPLKIKSICKAQSRDINQPNSNNSVMVQAPSKDIVKAVYQAEIMLHHTDKYDVIDIDKQYFRGHYFDLKQNQLWVETDQLVKSLTLMRSNTQNIKQKTPNLSKYQPNAKMNDLFHGCESSNLLLKSTKKIKQSKSVNSSRNQMYRTLYTTNNGNKSQLTEREKANLRSVCEEKRRQRVKCGVKVTNFILNDSPKGKYSRVQETNPERWRFFKKSQEHLKYRYKYLYHNRHSNSTNHSLKSKATNPETVFNTIHYA